MDKRKTAGKKTTGEADPFDFHTRLYQRLSELHFVNNWADFENFPYWRAMELLDLNTSINDDEDLFCNQIEKGVFKGINRLFTQFLKKS